MTNILRLYIALSSGVVTLLSFGLISGLSGLRGGWPDILCLCAAFIVSVIAGRYARQIDEWLLEEKP